MLLLTATRLNPIYTAIRSLSVGGLLTSWCRPDLIRKMVLSAFLFLGFYFFYFLTLLSAYPDYVLVWHLSAISQIMILASLWKSCCSHSRWDFCGRAFTNTLDGNDLAYLCTGTLSSQVRQNRIQQSLHDP
jgi:hypothetical protein